MRPEATGYGASLLPPCHACSGRAQASSTMYNTWSQSASLEVSYAVDNDATAQARRRAARRDLQRQASRHLRRRQRRTIRSAKGTFSLSSLVSQADVPHRSSNSAASSSPSPTAKASSPHPTTRAYPQKISTPFRPSSSNSAISPMRDSSRTPTPLANDHGIGSSESISRCPVRRRTKCRRVMRMP